jgi:multidrug resistance efflux pump
MDALAEMAPLAQISAVGALLLVIVGLIRTISRGDWVSRRELDYLRADRDARIAEVRQEAADWRAAHETSEKARELLSEQVRELVGSFRTVEHLLDVLRARAEGGGHVG